MTNVSRENGQRNRSGLINLKLYNMGRNTLWVFIRCLTGGIMFDLGELNDILTWWWVKNINGTATDSTRVPKIKPSPYLILRSNCLFCGVKIPSILGFYTNRKLLWEIGILFKELAIVCQKVVTGKTWILKLVGSLVISLYAE